ncbi:hypothetical protein JSE7799_02181 [Jannaschia seosinensis]|uniref:Uncharacterized protein n=1 Tax=Jannaschia seosinensis TaxID=313367 RepID=A0A0M7BCA6_9RHOB|nr:hypothetical protein JSE7799_02181 [Jannaschia seosinensis]
MGSPCWGAPARAHAPRLKRISRPEGTIPCHTIRGTSADGHKGPELTHVALRRTLAAATLPNSRGNLGGWITSTHSVKLGAMMPPSNPPPDNLHALLDFLETLE